MAGTAASKVNLVSQVSKGAASAVARGTSETIRNVPPKPEKRVGSTVTADGPRKPSGKAIGSG